MPPTRHNAVWSNSMRPDTRKRQRSDSRAGKDSSKKPRVADDDDDDVADENDEDAAADEDDDEDEDATGAADGPAATAKKNVGGKVPKEDDLEEIDDEE